MTEENHLKVVYDGDCALCQGARSWVERRDQDKSIRFETADPAIPAEARMLEVVHQDCRGIGFDGWVTILERLPRWRRLTPFLGLRSFRYLGSKVYELVAANRHRFRRDP